MKPRTTYPDWVEKFRGQGREIKHIGNNYYLHSYKTVYDSEKKRPKKISTGYLGKITPTGLIAPKAKTMKLNISAPLEYGISHLLDVLGKDILLNLKKQFGESLGTELFVLGKEGLIDPSPLKRKELIYKGSIDSLTYPNLKLSKSSLSIHLNHLGKLREQQLNFMKEYVVGNEFIIFDGTRLVSFSANNDLAQYGYNHCGIVDPQVNLLYCFSLKPEKFPVYFRANAGDKTDYDTIINAINELCVDNVIIVADKGFGSESNFNFLKKNNLNYLMPLRRNDTEIDYSKVDTSNPASFDGFFSCHERVIFYKVLSNNGIKETEIQVKKKGRPSKNSIQTPLETKIIKRETDCTILYFDEELKHREVRDYNKRLANQYADYSLKDYSARIARMGTITLRTNVDMDAKKLYETYKERELIEDGNKAWKNVLDINASNLQDKETYTGWLFMNHISLMLYYLIFNRIKEKGMTSTYSVEDVIAILKRTTKQTINGKEIIETGVRNKLDPIVDLFPECNT